MKKIRLFLIEFTYFRLSSRKCLIYKGLRGFLKMILIIFDVVGSGEMLDFSGFARSGYRSEFEVKCLGNVDFTMGLWIEQICRS